MDTASTSDAVTFITYVQTLKRKIKQFEKNVDVSTMTPFRFFNTIVCMKMLLMSLVARSCSATASVCWRSSGSSSHPLGCTSITSRGNGAPSVTS